MVNRAILGQLSDVDLRLLRIFRVVVESGGISAAELELNIGRSTISRHLKDLETRLQTTLCRRGRAGFALTAEGQHIYQATLRLQGAVDAFRAEISQVHAEMTGNLSLALFDKTLGNPNAKVERALQLFDDLAPKVTLDIYVESLTSVESGILEGRLQLGIVPAVRESSSLQYQPLFVEPVRLYCGSEHPLYPQRDGPVSREDLKRHKYAGLGYHSPNMENARNLGLIRSATAYDQEAVTALLLSGRYIGYLPEHYAKPLVAQGLIGPVSAPNDSYECLFQAVTRRVPKPSRSVASFLDCLTQAHAGQRQSLEIPPAG